jgi:FtsZ-binding cell division protein ZapB
VTFDDTDARAMERRDEGLAQAVGKVGGAYPVSEAYPVCSADRVADANLNCWWKRVAASNAENVEQHASALSAVRAQLTAAESALTALQRECDAYKRAKAENDKRFMRERDEARAERDALQADHARLRGESEKWAATARTLAGALSACDGYTHRHPQDVLDEFVGHALSARGGNGGE